jgi:hypothetical protein
MTKRLMVMIGFVMVGACAAPAASGVDAELEQEALTTRCKGTQAYSTGFTTWSKDGQQIATRPVDARVAGGNGDEVMWAIQQELSHEAARRTGDEIMNYPPTWIGAAVRNVRNGGKYQVCSLNYSTVTDETTGEVFYH